MRNQSRETCKLDAVRQDVGDGQVDLAVFSVGLVIEVIVLCEDSADVIRLASIVEYCGGDDRHERREKRISIV